MTLSILAFAMQYGIPDHVAVPKALGHDALTGLPIDAAFLRDPDRRIPWATLVALLLRLDAVLQTKLGNDWPEIYARDSFKHPERHLWNAVAIGAMRAVTSPEQAYKLGCLLAGRLNVHNISFAWTQLEGSRLRLELWTRPEDAPCPVFFHITSHILPRMPTVMNLPQSVVTMTFCDGRRGTFDITLPPSATLWARLKQVFQRRRSAASLIDDLAQREIDLQQHVNDVERTRAELESRIVERTAALADANAGLRAAERKYRELVEASAHVIWSVDRQGRLTFLSPVAREVLGRDPSALLGKSISALLRDPYAAFGVTRSLLRGGKLEHDAQIANPGQRDLMIRSHCVLMRDENGRIVGVTGTSLDITEHHERAVATARSQSILKRAQALAGFGSWEWNPATNEQVWSDETYRIFGYEPGRIAPSAELVLSHLDPDGTLGLRYEFDQVHNLTKPLQVEHALLRRDGTRRIIRAQIEVLRTNDGRPLHIIGAVEDVTLVREHEAALMRARDESDAANAIKSAFLANMSHEIRTPLTAVLGFSELLASPTLPAAQRQRCIETIARNGRHLMELIEDLLDLSKIEAGYLRIQRSAIAPTVEIHGALAFLREQAEAKGLTFSLTIAPALPPVIETDPMRLRQIMINLVGNAVKFTDRGTIEVTIDAQHAGERGETTELLLRVRDTGCGLPNAGRHRLFEPFAQLGTEDGAKRRGGTGLGLALSRQLARALGGDVLLEDSQQGRGSTFTACIPVTIPSESVQATAPVTTLKRLSQHEDGAHT